MPARIVLLVVAGFAVCLSNAGTKADSKHFPGVFGDDDREVVAESNAAFNAVGHINIAGYRTKRRCTGTLVAADLVVTAAHCVVGQRSGRATVLRNIHFVAGVRRDANLGHSRARCVHLLKPDAIPKPQTADQLKSDVAVVVLEKRLDVPPITVASARSLEKGQPLVHPSYPRDRRYLLTADSRCRLRAKREGLWLTDCDTNFASSGGPVLVVRKEEHRLAAVMVGIVRHKFSIAVPVAAWRHLLSKRDCP